MFVFEVLAVMLGEGSRKGIFQVGRRGQWWSLWVHTRVCLQACV